MSHFTGLVIMTPQYAAKHSIEDALEKYDENREVPEYSKGEVSDYEKVEVIDYYKNGGFKTLLDALYEKLANEGKVAAFAPEENNTKYLQLKDALGREGFEKAYVEFFKETYPGLFEQFDAIYAENGDAWNDNSFRINPLTGKWEEYSTYNKDSKWDWYQLGGRWNKHIKTKAGEYVDECLLEEIDFTDFTDDDYEEEEKTDIWGEKYHELKEGRQYHYTNSTPPFCLVIDGQWIEKGEMGWWGIVSNAKEQVNWNDEVMAILNRLPGNSEVSSIDFHI